MPAPRLVLVATVAALGIASRLTAADPFTFRDGDRVVFLGSTLIEREQKYGYWELDLTLKNADKNVTFRNLGWSGDTVFGEARNGFDESPKGFERLVALTLELKPTVVVVCYGHNESFEGKAGVGKFAAGLEKLLDALAPAKARVILLSPTPFGGGGPALDWKARNADLTLYRDAIRATATKRKLAFVDLFGRCLKEAKGGESWLPTTDGMHLGEGGYATTAHFLFGDELPPGTENPISDLPYTPLGQALREKMIEKNELFFHRWRPQNQTYLFGFRKHEQGQNANEVAEFDPLVAAAEKEIAKLRSELAKQTGRK